MKGYRTCRPSLRRHWRRMMNFSGLLIARHTNAYPQYSHVCFQEKERQKKNFPTIFKLDGSASTASITRWTPSCSPNSKSTICVFYVKERWTTRGGSGLYLTERLVDRLSDVYSMLIRHSKHVSGIRCIQMLMHVDHVSLGLLLCWSSWTDLRVNSVVNKVWSSSGMPKPAATMPKASAPKGIQSIQLGCAKFGE